MSQQPQERSQSAEAAAVLAAAQAYRVASLRFRAQYMREFLDLWPILAKEGDLQRWLRLNVALVRRWQTPSRSLAMEFLHTQAQIQNVATNPSPVPEMPTEQIVTNLVSRGPVVAKKARLLGMDELHAWEKAEAAAAASGGRMVLDGGRDALKAQKALGYMRVSDGDPCYFCAMLVSRGAVYSSEETAGRTANNRFQGPGLFKFHDLCGCTCAPIFVRGDFMSEDALKYRDIWEQTFGKAGETNAGNKVTGVDHFRAVLEGRAPSPLS